MEPITPNQTRPPVNIIAGQGQGTTGGGERERERPSISFFFFLSILFYLVSNNNNNNNININQVKNEFTSQSNNSINKLNSNKLNLLNYLDLNPDNNNKNKSIINNFINPILLPSIKSLMSTNSSTSSSLLYHQNLTGFTRGNWLNSNYSYQQLALNQFFNSSTIINNNTTTILNNRTALRPNTINWLKGGKITFNFREEQTSAIILNQSTANLQGGQLMSHKYHTQNQIQQPWQAQGPVTYLNVS